jgi:hypothetical protein
VVAGTLAQSGKSPTGDSPSEPAWTKPRCGSRETSMWRGLPPWDWATRTTPPAGQSQGLTVTFSVRAHVRVHVSTPSGQLVLRWLCWRHPTTKRHNTTNGHTRIAVEGSAQSVAASRWQIAGDRNVSPSRCAYVTAGRCHGSTPGPPNCLAVRVSGSLDALRDGQRVVPKR